ncbi:MAG: hypothetical protein ACN6NV_08640 [Acinetobacter gandensis]|uniref:hypothetical protein n=1 Tax=Acinetobacter gandensis TaxID=1443941 RepID=UPI003CFE7B7E
MNLTIEQMRKIVDGAPEWAESFNIYLTAYGSRGVPCRGDILLAELRAAIADHDTKPCLHGYDIACLICGFGTKDGKRVWSNQKNQSAFEDDRTDHVSDIRNHIAPTTRVIEHE